MTSVVVCAENRSKQKDTSMAAPTDTLHPRDHFRQRFDAGNSEQNMVHSF